MKKTAYTPAVKAEIVTLFGEVSAFIEIREHRGKLFRKSAGGLKVAAGWPGLEPLGAKPRLGGRGWSVFAKPRYG